MSRARSRSRERPPRDPVKLESSGYPGLLAEKKPYPASASVPAPSAAASSAAPAAAAPAPLVEQANFGLSGALSKDIGTGNAVSGVALKFVQPPEARLPTARWRLYVFKGEAAEPLEVLHLHRASAYLFGKDAAVVDVRLEHPSISKQHAVIQFRGVAVPREPGDTRPPQQLVRPYIMDLESSNGTLLNDTPLEPARYVELRVGDRLRFGGSTREYVLMLEAEG